ncbi:MAG: TIGR02147 family protein [Bacteriovoracaceae bacterium]
MNDLFECHNYRQVVESIIKSHKGERGFQGKLAEAMGCHPSYLSQVLNGPQELTVDHALGLANFLHFSELETEYFLNLLHLARSSSSTAKKFYQQKIRQTQELKKNVSEQVKAEKIFSEQNLATYYSSWMYIAIHILCSIPEFSSSAQKISERLLIPLVKVQKILSELVQLGLLENELGTYRLSSKNIHLPKESAFIDHHHKNWRIYMAERGEFSNPQNLHYSVVFAMSKKDFEKFKACFLKAIKESNEILAPSPEEEIYALNLDLTKLI